jgi:hypothetical protein
MGQKRVRVGDVFEIPLSNGERAFGHYMRSDRMGPLIQVYDIIMAGDESGTEILERLRSAERLFPPIYTGLGAAVRTGLWRVIGRLPTAGFERPAFVSVHHEGFRPIGPWYYRCGEEMTRLGERLLDEYKQLEFLAVWSPHDVAHRIETGENPYERMIKAG